MKAIMVMFDSLNRHMLSSYGCDWIHTPNFARLAETTVVFDNAYVGSMPCAPARRDLQTGRYNFLHRSWGPLEPFDNSFTDLLKNNGVYTHLSTDHQHYFEDGMGNYHTRYNSWHFSRGQEGDPWKAEVKDPDIPDTLNRSDIAARHDWVNRKYMKDEKDQPQAQTFANGLEFIRTNYKEDNWFLQIETFDPHEPFFTQQQYKDLYPHDYDGPHFDWPKYKRVTEPREQIEHIRYEYAALVSMCDRYLGKVLDMMDKLELWEDTMLIVNTDHGFLLGEHGWWAKCIQPFYNEVAHIPLFVWDPRYGKKGERRKSLVQLIDMAPTLLDYFGMAIPEETQGVRLEKIMKTDQSPRKEVIFGIHGGHVNITDGRYVYMRAPINEENNPLYNYTLVPSHMKEMFQLEELQDIQLESPFSFTKGCSTMKINANLREQGKGHAESGAFHFGNLLFDLKIDPKQEQPIDNKEIEERMTRKLVYIMQANDAPKEQFERLGLGNILNTV